jgi:hypothetical protein
VLVKAPLGPASYSAVVDAKSHLNTRRADVEADNIAYHKRHHKATYAMAIAKKFVQGRRVEDAIAQNVSFLTTECLKEWIKLHFETPLPLTTYRAFFEAPGLISELPDPVIVKAKRLKSLYHLMSEVFTIFAEAHRVRLSMNIPIAHLLRTANERHFDDPYEIHDLQDIVNFLKSPFIACLGEDEDGGLYFERKPEELPYVMAATLNGLSSYYNV